MSMLQILKRSPFILLIICVDLMYLLLMILPSNATDIFLDIILPALYLLSIVCVFFLNKEENGDYALIKISLIGKLALIPWFGVNALFAAILFWGGIIIPINWFGLPVIFLMDLLMLIITALYATLGINSFYKKNHLPLKNLMIALQWIFAVDVVGIIFAFIQSHKYLKLADEK